MRERHEACITSTRDYCDCDPGNNTTPTTVATTTSEADTTDSSTTTTSTQGPTVTSSTEKITTSYCKDTKTAEVIMICATVLASSFIVSTGIQLKFNFVRKAESCYRKLRRYFDNGQSNSALLSTSGNVIFKRFNSISEPITSPSISYQINTEC